MKTRRIVISDKERGPDSIRFSERNARYLRDVLRLKPGACVDVVDRGRAYLVCLETVRDREVTGHLLEPQAVPLCAGIEVVVAFSCVRPGPLEEILRHGTELGVTRFVPLLTRRTTRRPDVKRDRWQVIIHAAMAQCCRLTMPELTETEMLEDFLTREIGQGGGLILSTASAAQPILEALEETQPDRVVLLVGPEGGFDAVEESRAAAAGFRPITLGPSVLRTETAAVVAAGIVQSWYGWRGGRPAIREDDP